MNKKWHTVQFWDISRQQVGVKQDILGDIEIYYYGIFNVIQIVLNYFKKERKQ